MKILETSQFRQLDKHNNYNFKKLEEIKNRNDAESRLWDNSFTRIREVKENEEPRIGMVWYKEENNSLVLFKTNYDTSG